MEGIPRRYDCAPVNFQDNSAQRWGGRQGSGGGCYTLFISVISPPHLPLRWPDRTAAPLEGAPSAFQNKNQRLFKIL